jgi:dTDP-4-amino-4,6-dideoxygalactose transaminase
VPVVRGAYADASYEHVYHQYTIRVPGGRRDALVEHLTKQGIGTGVYYPVPVHKQTFYMGELGYNLTLPEAERAAAEVLSLPVHPALTQVDLETIIKTINRWIAQVETPYMASRSTK